MPAMPSAGSPDRSYAPAGTTQRVEQRSEQRIPLEAHVRLQYSSILDFHETQSVNISRSGMFVVSESPGRVGSLVDFEFCLEDGLQLLKGKGEVVRVTQHPVSGPTKNCGVTWNTNETGAMKLTLESLPNARARNPPVSKRMLSLR